TRHRPRRTQARPPSRSSLRTSAARWRAPLAAPRCPTIITIAAGSAPQVARAPTGPERVVRRSRAHERCWICPRCAFRSVPCIQTVLRGGRGSVLNRARGWRIRILHAPSKLTHALTERCAKLRQLAGTEDDQHQDHDQDQVCRLKESFNHAFLL